MNYYASWIDENLTMSIVIHGIPACDTMKKARRWLDEHEVEYTFHNYKKLGADASLLRSWCKKTDWQSLVNRRGTTWRKLPESDREELSEKTAIELMQANPSLIKRPVLVKENGDILIGFDEDQYSKLA